MLFSTVKIFKLKTWIMHFSSLLNDWETHTCVTALGKCCHRCWKSAKCYQQEKKRKIFG